MRADVEAMLHEVRQALAQNARDREHLETAYAHLQALTRLSKGNRPASLRAIVVDVLRGAEGAPVSALTIWSIAQAHGITTRSVDPARNVDATVHNLILEGLPIKRVGRAMWSWAEPLVPDARQADGGQQGHG